MSKILRLTIKKKWFDLLIAGTKTEEYREIKPYYQRKFERELFSTECPYDQVEFINGYHPDSPRATFELKEIIKGTGNPEWGAVAGQVVYVLKLGKLRASSHKLKAESTK